VANTDHKTQGYPQHQPWCELIG